MKFERVGPGVYDSDDGRFTLYRIPGLNPPAWNIEYTTQHITAWVDADPENRTFGDLSGCVVDGAATMRDALALFEDPEVPHDDRKEHDGEAPLHDRP